MTAPKTVLTAVVSEARAELRLINPDYRRVGLMLVDGLEALMLAAPSLIIEESIEVSSRTQASSERPARAKKKSGRE